VFLSIAGVKTVVFWDVMPYCLVDGSNVFDRPAASCLQAEERAKWGKVTPDAEKGELGLNKSIEAIGPVNGCLVSQEMSKKMEKTNDKKQRGK
jgi:hypothetical protein